MSQNRELHPDYPTTVEIDQWLDSIFEMANNHPLTTTPIENGGMRHSYGVRHTDTQFLKFSSPHGDDFYGYWQPAHSSPAPLLVHVPGYGAEMSIHPELQASGFNVLHVSPLGYSTPEGEAAEKKVDGSWPVLPETITSGGKKGYRQWLANVVGAVNWAQSLPQVIPSRLSFYGTSQGGGCSLLLASLYKDRGVRAVAADVPFLTGFCLKIKQDNAYTLAVNAIEAMKDKKTAWHSVGLVDTLCHIHRLDLPVLLTAGTDDRTCKAASIEALFYRLPSTKSYTLLKGVAHRYTSEFIPLAKTWFGLYG